jgi:hypothetical protein
MKISILFFQVITHHFTNNYLMDKFFENVYVST